MLHAPVTLAELAAGGPVCLDSDATVVEASKAMHDRDAAHVVVTEKMGGAPKPVAILSARDIVDRVVAFDLPASVITVGDIAWSRIGAEGACSRALAALCRSRSLFLPVIGDDGKLAALLSLDELVAAAD
ncbi:MAG: CBS domain-containing protein [Betaproteobacteria bacterium]